MYCKYCYRRMGFSDGMWDKRGGVRCSDQFCIFEYVRTDMDGAVVVCRIKNPDRLAALKQNLTN